MRTCAKRQLGLPLKMGAMDQAPMQPLLANWPCPTSMIKSGNPARLNIIRYGTRNAPKEKFTWKNTTPYGKRGSLSPVSLLLKSLCFRIICNQYCLHIPQVYQLMLQLSMPCSEGVPVTIDLYTKAYPAGLREMGYSRTQYQVQRVPRMIPLVFWLNITTIMNEDHKKILKASTASLSYY